MKRFVLVAAVVAALAPMWVRADFGDPEVARFVKLDASRKLSLVEGGVVKCEIVVEANSRRL